MLFLRHQFQALDRLQLYDVNGERIGEKGLNEAADHALDMKPHRESERARKQIYQLTDTIENLERTDYPLYVMAVYARCYPEDGTYVVWHLVHVQEIVRLVRTSHTVLTDDLDKAISQMSDHQVTLDIDLAHER